MKMENSKKYCSFAACATKEGVERYLCCYFCLDKCKNLPLVGCQIVTECEHRQTKTEIELLILTRNLKEEKSG